MPSLPQPARRLKTMNLRTEEQKARHREHQRRYRLKNRERCIEATKKWKEKNKDKVQKWRNENRDKLHAYRRNNRKRYPEKERARSSLNEAIYRGAVTKPAHCEECGKKSTIHGHHEDYSKPFDVKWLCSKCHHLAHKKTEKKP